MVHALRASHLLTEPFRGEPATDLDALADILLGLGRLGSERPDVASVDLNPLIVRAADGKPVAVDALVELSGAGGGAPELAAPAPRSPEAILERFRPLFHPRGIVVAGVSSHPAKFGFAAMHNLMRFGYEGALFGVKPDGYRPEGLGSDPTSQKLGGGYSVLVAA